MVSRASANLVRARHALQNQQQEQMVRFNQYFDSQTRQLDTLADADNPPFVNIPLRQRIVRDWHLLKWKFKGIRVFTNPRIYPHIPRDLNSAERIKAEGFYNIQIQVGDRTILSANEAKRMKRRLERNLKCKINFELSEGDIVLSCFDQLPQTVMSLNGDTGQPSQRTSSVSEEARLRLQRLKNRPRRRSSNASLPTRTQTPSPVNRPNSLDHRKVARKLRKPITKVISPNVLTNYDDDFEDESSDEDDESLTSDPEEEDNNPPIGLCMPPIIVISTNC
eukprot:maker-scaffold1246_size53250-snap-gene-0.9 protein:Tk08359 transcript:maker-scaffold1246_size53250-snap-gene-0.9-mRNA-1 annotation:"---NA---"